MSKTYIIAMLSALHIIVSLSSCGTNRQLVSERRPSEIRELTVVKPITNIEIIESGNRGTYSKMETDNATANIVDVLNRTIPTDIKIQNLKMDTTDKVVFQRELHLLVNYVEGQQQIKGVSLSPKMLAIMNKYNQDFAIGVLEVGFARAKGNYGRQIAKGVGIGILTLGFYVPVPIKSASTMICLIVDRKNNNVAFYRKNNGQELNPTEKTVIERQLKGILDPYFRANKPTAKKAIVNRA